MKILVLFERLVVAFETMAKAQADSAQSNRTLCDLRSEEVVIAKERLRKDREWWATWTPEGNAPPRMHHVQLSASAADAAAMAELKKLIDKLDGLRGTQPEVDPPLDAGQP